jgi:hypothetical protein
LCGHPVAKQRAQYHFGKPLISIEQAIVVHKRAHEPKFSRAVDGAGHNDIDSLAAKGYWERIQNFADYCWRRAASPSVTVARPRIFRTGSFQAAFCLCSRSSAPPATARNTIALIAEAFEDLVRDFIIVQRDRPTATIDDLN